MTEASGSKVLELQEVCGDRDECVQSGLVQAAGVSAGNRELSWLFSCVTNLPDSSELLFK